MSSPDFTASANVILANLSSEDSALLAPHLEGIGLPLRKSLEIRHTPIEHIYFVEYGLASVVAKGAAGGRSIEVGIIGREGVTGMPVILGTDRSPHDTFMQVAGSGMRLPTEALRDAMARSKTLRDRLLLSTHVLSVQMAQTALANGRSKIEDRLARWILMAHDRLDGDELALTHEFLAVMLGVRRPGVTLSLQLLEKAGLISSKRGMVTVIDREGLEEACNGVYGAPEEEQRRLFG
jgi:CRP-like cAMP-binding protein